MKGTLRRNPRLTDKEKQFLQFNARFASNRMKNIRHDERRGLWDKYAASTMRMYTRSANTQAVWFVKFFGME